MSDGSVGDAEPADGHSYAVGIVIEVIRLTFEVMDKASQKKNDDNKKD